jgi:hypothetical protein
VPVNHHENANWPRPAGTPNAGYPPGESQPDRTALAASRALNLYPSLFLLILVHVTHCEQAEFLAFRAA